MHVLGEVVLRPLDVDDAEQLYLYKNDPDVGALLGGVSLGYTRSDIRDWIEYHRQRKDELLWAIAAADDGRCLGHVGFYKIDYRARSAEFGILIGDKSQWGKGHGRRIGGFSVEYGFEMLNLNRIALTVLEGNSVALRLYEKVGFREEGRLREGQYKRGAYVDLILMSLLRSEWALGGGHGA